MEPEAAEALERAMTTLDGTALDLARKGLIGADYKQLLDMLGMPKTGAGKAAQGVQKLLSRLSAKGIGGMTVEGVLRRPAEGNRGGAEVLAEGGADGTSRSAGEGKAGQSADGG